jgi:hypothetical protein
VNQQDLGERSQQVKRMADIYSRATRVVVWLGPERADTSLAIAFFNEITSHIVVEWEQMIVRPNSSDDVLWQTRALERFSSNDSILVAVDDLLSRSWFGRLWIWQEIHLATSATVFCGTKSIPWHAVRISVVWLNWIFMNIGTIPLPSLRDSIQSPLDLCTCSGNSFLEQLLYQTRYCKCSDKRDRIFALLSLVCPYPSIDIQPDYTKTVEEVFMDTMQKIVHCSKDLLGLSTAEMRMSEGSTDTSSLPSWVPDWSSPAYRINPTTAWASGASSVDAGFPRKGVMCVTGKVLGSIQEVEPFHQGRQTFVPEVRRVTNQLGLLGNATNLRELSRTLCVGQFSYHDHPQRFDFPDFEESVSSLAKILNESYQSVEGNDLDTLYLPFWGSTYHYCSSRCMVTGVGSNSNRLIGIAPLAARPGDRICIFLGCDHVMILRPSTPLSTSRLANMDTFLVVGQAYYDGFMDGEALLGPFAPGTRQVSR